MQTKEERMRQMFVQKVQCGSVRGARWLGQVEQIQTIGLVCMIVLRVHLYAVYVGG